VVIGGECILNPSDKGSEDPDCHSSDRKDSNIGYIWGSPILVSYEDI
jgi:hypothetical protein